MFAWWRSRDASQEQAVVVSGDDKWFYDLNKTYKALCNAVGLGDNSDKPCLYERHEAIENELEYRKNPDQLAHQKNSMHQAQDQLSNTENDCGKFKAAIQFLEEELKRYMQAPECVHETMEKNIYNAREGIKAAQKRLAELEDAKGKLHAEIQQYQEEIKRFGPENIAHLEVEKEGLEAIFVGQWPEHAEKHFGETKFGCMQARVEARRKAAVSAKIPADVPRLENGGADGPAASSEAGDEGAGPETAQGGQGEGSSMTGNKRAGPETTQAVEDGADFASGQSRMLRRRKNSPST